MKALLGDHAVARLFKQESGLQFADVAVPHTAFKRVVRDLEFELAELAIVTFLLAKAHGRPLRLLPAVLTSRFQHALLVHDASRGALSPSDLRGRRVGQRSWSVTTATWVRGILDEQYGVEPGAVRWVGFEEPHVAEFRDPPNTERAPAGKSLEPMLLAGELDAAILGAPPQDQRLRPVIADPEAAAADWQRRHGAIQINHMLVVRSDVTRETAEGFYGLFRRSREAAGGPEACPCGVEANRRNLEAAIACCDRQGMLPRRLGVDELFE